MAMCKFGKQKTVTKALAMVRRSIEGAVEAAWVSLGGSTWHLTSIRLWLTKWRHTRMEPAFYRLCREIIYRSADLNAWSDANRVDPSKRGRS